MEWLLAEENTMLAEPNIKRLARARTEAVESPVLADKLREAGLRSLGEHFMSKKKIDLLTNSL